jgi:phage virion morphogenesis protein
MIHIRINDSEFQNDLSQLQGKLGNMRPAMAGIANMMLEAVERNFATETDPTTGLRWTPLSAKTIQKRAKRGHWPGKILQVSGNLAASISANYGDDYAIVGTNKVYAAIHHFGGSTGRRHAANIPARPYLELPEQAKQDIINTVSSYLTQGLT